MRYIKGLDTVRAFAVISVILWHWYPRFPIHTVKGAVQQLVLPTGEFGVTLFFVLSGFLITSILLKAKAASNNNTHIIKNFMIRRSLRIFPIYYLFIGFLLLIGYPIGRENLVYFLTYTSNFLVIKERFWVTFAHTWSLSIEEQFYLIWPWLVLYVRNAYLKYLFIGFIVLAIISTFIYHFVLHIDFDPVFTTCCFDAFGIGGLYAYCQQTELNYTKFKKYLKMALPVALTIYFAWKVVPYFGLSPKLNSFQRTVDSIIAIWIIDVVINNKSEWARKHLLEQHLLNTIGKVSYGVYLFHTSFPFIYNKLLIDPIISVVPASAGVLHNFWVSQILMYILLFVFCYLSFTLIESKITNLKKWFAYTGNKEILKPVAQSVSRD